MIAIGDYVISKDRTIKGTVLYVIDSSELVLHIRTDAGDIIQATYYVSDPNFEVYVALKSQRSFF